MNTEHDKILIAERRKLIAGMGELGVIRQLMVDRIEVLDRTISTERKVCSFCSRSHADPEIESIAHGQDGSSICNLCVGATRRKLSAPVRTRRVPNNRPARKKMPARAQEVWEQVCRSYGVDPAKLYIKPERMTATAILVRDEFAWAMSFEKMPSGNPYTHEMIGGWLGRDRATITYAIRRHQARLDAQVKQCA